MIGIDIESSQIKLAQERSESLGLSNCRFETASVYNLPLSDNSVDTVFGHTILMQFRDIKPVLAEVKRVLKPGGLVGFRDIDFGASLYHSEDSALREIMSILRRSILHNDGNPDIGRVLPSLLSRAGFNILNATPIYSCAPTPEAKAGMYTAMTRLWEQADFVDQAESLGWISANDRVAMIDRMKLEGSDPESFSGTTFVEVVARKGHD